MKANKILVGLILSCIIMVSYGQNNNCCPTKDIIRVNGNGQTRIKPDIAIIYTSLTAEGQTAQDALKQLDPKLDQITTNLLSGVDNVTDIMTSSISIYPRYSFINMTNQISGYVVYMSLTITISGIQEDSLRIAKVMDILGNAEVTSITGLTYDSIDPNAGKTVARTNAFDDASSKARLYAQLAGRSLGKINVIDEISISYTPYYYSNVGLSPSFYYSSTTSDMSTSSTEGSSGTSQGTSNSQIPQIPVGTVFVTAQVFITWELS